MTGNERLREIAFIYEVNTDDDNQWDACEITERIADILVDDGFFLKCDEHGVFDAELGICPRCDTDDEEEEGESDGP